MALSKAEQQELKELEELEKLEAMEARSQNFAPTVEEMEAARAAVEPTTGEALAAGWVQGIPFLKDGVAAADGIADAMEEDGASFDTAYSNYKENLDEINKDLKNVEEQSPWTFAAGDIAGTAATFAAGGAALKATQLGAALTPLGVGVVSGAGAGAASGLSRSEDRGISDVAAGGAMGALSELGGHYLMKGIKKGGRYLLDKADDMGSQAAKKLMGIENVSSKKQFHKHLKRTNQKESEFLNDVLTQKMDDTGEVVVNFSEKPELMIDKIKVRKGQLGNQIGKVYKQIDEAHKVDIDISDLKASLSDDVAAPFRNSDDPGMNQIGKELDEYISSIGRKSKGFKKEITQEGTKIIEDVVQEDKWTLSRTHKLQKDIRKRIENIYKRNGLDISAAKEQERKVATSLGKHMDEVLDAVSTEADDAIGQVKNLRKQFGNMATVEESVEAAIYRQADNPMAMLKEAIGMRSMIISGAATTGMGPAGLAVGPIAERIIRSPKTPLYLSEGLKKVGNVINAMPSGEIATRLNSAAMMNNQKFEDTVYGLIGQVNLSQNPIQRTAEDVKLKQKDIRNYIKLNQPTSLPAFDRALKDGDEAINAFMDGVSKIEDIKDMFEPGVGFGGKVYDPADKAVLERQLKQSDVPAAQRMEMLEDLRNNGNIPNMQEVIRPVPQPHVPRTKKVHNY
jgi:hypothetical protein